MSCISREQMKRMMDAISGYCGPCPDSVKVHTISHSVERFCKDSGGIRTHLGPVPANRPGGMYFAVAPFGGVVVDVKNVVIGRHNLNRDLYKVWLTDDGRARVEVLTLAENSSDTIEFDAYWRPGERTVQMPQAWFDRNFDAIMHGSIAAVLSQIGTAWGNPQLATKFEEEYARDVHDAVYELRASQGCNGRISLLDASSGWI